MPLSDALCSVCGLLSGGAWISVLVPSPPCPGAFVQCTQCTSVPSGPTQRYPLHLPPRRPSPALCAGFGLIQYIPCPSAPSLLTLNCSRVLL